MNVPSKFEGQGTTLAKETLEADRRAMLGKYEIIQGDVREVLPSMASDHYHCVVTSPPYF